MDDDIIVTLKRSNDLLMTFGNDYSDVFLPAIDEIVRLRKAMDVQANAVNVLHQAETSELNHLRKTAQEAYMAKMTLDSEREANRILTDEIARLRNNQSILITSFRINMMRLCPEYSHEEFDKDIAALLKEKE